MSITGTWALPVKRELTGPAPGWTDYKHIHVLSHITGDDERVLLTHESSHVWLNHDRRCKPLADKRLAAVACELEIARAIYTPEDTQVIERTYSPIKGGYTANSMPELPADLIYMEDIYDWLVKNQPELPKEHGCQKCKEATGEATPIGDDKQQGQNPGGQDGGDQDGENAASEDQKPTGQGRDIPSPGELIEDAKKRVEHASSVAAGQLATQVKVKRSFLASEIEALNSQARKKKLSYSRPNKRKLDAEFSRGHKRQLAKPKVIIYVDRSGSFTPEKTEKAQLVLSRLLARYQTTISASTLYFTCGRIWDREPDYNGDTPYQAIVNHIAENSPALAIVITDDDPLNVNTHKLAAKAVVIPVGCQTTHFAKHFNLKEEIL